MSRAPGLALVGLMGSGKSTVAGLLGERLDLPVVDTDELIERRAGRSISAIFAERGEHGFRDLEIDALSEAIQMLPCVISTGGGVVTTARGRALLASVPLVVHLDVSPAEAGARLARDTSRPLLSADPHEALERLHQARAVHYGEVAQLSVDVDARSPQQIAAEIVEQMEASR